LTLIWKKMYIKNKKQFPSKLPASFQIANTWVRSN